jgi:hypothetical protein
LKNKTEEILEKKKIEEELLTKKVEKIQKMEPKIEQSKASKRYPYKREKGSKHEHVKEKEKHLQNIIKSKYSNSTNAFSSEIIDKNLLHEVISKKLYKFEEIRIKYFRRT